MSSSRIANFFAILAVLFCLRATSAHAVIFTGSLQTTTELKGTGVWKDDLKITWTITSIENGDNDYWQYVYRMTDASGTALKKTVSHLDIEVSANAKLSDFWGFKADGVGFTPASDSIKTYSSANPSNPNMPGPLFALKLDLSATEYSFYSYRDPVWGDFYSKDGKSKIGGVSVDNTIWNADFLKADPASAAKSGLPTDAYGNYIYKILRPDTTTSGGPAPSIPEPTTVLLVSIGLAAAAFKRSRIS